MKRERCSYEEITAFRLSWKASTQIQSGRYPLISLLRVPQICITVPSGLGSYLPAVGGEPASHLPRVMGRINFHVTVGPRSLVPWRLSARGHDQLLEAAYMPCHMTLRFQSRPCRTRNPSRTLNFYDSLFCLYLSGFV